MDATLKHTSLSCVHYQDDLGKLLAYVALGPLFIVCFQFAKAYTRREVHEAVLLAGLVLEEGVARVLKSIIKHPRPATCKMLHMCHSHGMPSSHTSMMFFYLTVTGCWAALLWRRRPALARALSAAEQLFCAVMSVAVAVSRVYLGYHSVDQVLAGAAFGTAFGLLWLAAMHGLRGVYGAVAALPLLQQLGVKDTYGCAEPLLIEQQAHSKSKGD